MMPRAMFEATDLYRKPNRKPSLSARGRARWVRTVAFALFGAATFFLATPRAHAQETTVTLQEPRHRQGYYLALGFGGAAVSVDDHGTTDVFGGTQTTIRLGQMVTRRFGLGLQINSGGVKHDQEVASLFGLAIEAQLELVPNLALHGGAGLGIISITDNADPNGDLSGSYGAGYLLGLSYDWFFTRQRLTGGWAVTPFVTVHAMPENSVKAFGGVFGVQISYWSGLPSNQLKLPESEAYKRK